MIVYQGVRNPETGKLRILRFDSSAETIRPLNPRNDLYNHSPDGFEVGYHGSGPAQTALAILADHLRDDERAVRLHQEFKRAVIAKIDRQADFAIADDDVDGWLEVLEAEKGSQP
jgi:hypothetical protein